ncbi:MAG: RNA polymerase subunit sigma-24 [Candidatus Marinimicrobia bacterium]|nr:RNA polymerase subunit sigma-24 [Candidatus Neomarinimicrobiota bacterium]|tara:strand:+ start:162 stop:743 length:582 start_codon:yes stop_codon:yes gene_type:complete
MSQFELTDEELIEKFQNGDIGAYTEIVNRYKDRLYNFIYRYLYDSDRAEDILQDTFIKLYTHKNSYRQIAKFSTWLYTIAGNLAKTELRKLKRRKTYSISEVSRNEKEFIIKSPNTDTENDANSINIEKSIQKALNQLPQDFKTIIILRDIQELSYEDISCIVNVPIGTVKSRINRGRLKLQKLLTNKGERII